MRVRTSARITDRRHARVPRRPPLPAPAPPVPPRPAAAGGSDDRAWYGCPCGLLFEAHVTASVVCPHCAAPQPW